MKLRLRPRRLPALVLAVVLLFAGAALAPGAALAVDPPPFPTNVQASDGAYDNKVRVSWFPSAGANSYRIFRAVSLDGAKTSIANTSNLYYDDFEPGPLVVRYYWVLACIDNANCSGGGNNYGTSDSGFRGLAAPVANASDGTYTGGVRITWPPIQGAEAYTLYRGLSDAGYTKVVPNITATSYDDLTTTPGVIYYYWLMAVSTMDDSAMGPSNTGYSTYIAPNVAAGDGTHTDRTRVTWSYISNAGRYQVLRKPAAGGTEVSLGATSNTMLDDLTGAPGTLYTYKVRACNAAETICGAYGSDNGYRALSAPINLYASDGAYADKVRLTWNSVAGATNYQVWRALSPAGTRTQIASPVSSDYDDTGATAGVTYYYWVKACNDTRCSADSISDSGYRQSVAASPTATATWTATPTRTATATRTPAAGTPTPTRTRVPGLQRRFTLPLVRK